MNSMEVLMLCSSLFFFFNLCNSMDTITPETPIPDGDYITSSKKIFTLGFFSLGNSQNRYVGIWYTQIPDQTVVWVANRDSPINDTSGSIEIDGDGGGIVVIRSNRTGSVWSSHVSDTGRRTFARLLDTGNLQLCDNRSREILWQSFDHPSNTFIPHMKIGLTKSTGLNRMLTSWKSPEDPSTGNFTHRINPNGFPQMMEYNGLKPWWRTGSWTGKKWTGVPGMAGLSSSIYNLTFTNNEDEISLEFSVKDDSILSKAVLHDDGVQRRYNWIPHKQEWVLFWSGLSEQCDYYGNCGPNSNCGSAGQCSCLPGFEPKSPQEWLLIDGSKGCVRKGGGASSRLPCHSGEGFVKIARVKIPDTSETQVDMRLGLKECEDKCLKNCSCVAFASAYYEGDKGETGCLTWHGDLLDTRTYPDSGQDFYVRADAAELAQWKKHDSIGKTEITLIGTASVAAALFVFAIGICLLRRKIKESRRSNKLLNPFFEDDLGAEELDDSIRNKDLPFLELGIIAQATNNFSTDNKLGQGGFGSVYKGVLQNGREIAVKRLSKHSGQGIEEFKNEIVLISKLQHRNLVRILGCCVHGDEKMLIYEYLPNNSLDSFIFDEGKKHLLDWTKRFEIICGIARGILYLHQDSRLRIIHRDLKASNVLLDASMIPKISDFGMARIFSTEQIEGTTNRVVGTYGYMSPEYAMAGQFSIKSDVYSFGVLLLEIVTGRKNSVIYEESPSSNLVGHVWELWKEGRAAEIIDKSLEETQPLDEILRCIQIGLLCVQENAAERPTMSWVAFTLVNNTTELPTPNYPAFILRRTCNNRNGFAGSSEEMGSSVNDVTLTVVQGR